MPHIRLFPILSSLLLMIGLLFSFSLSVQLLPATAASATTHDHESLKVSQTSPRAVVSGATIYVNQLSTSAMPTGMSWTEAYTDLQDALTDAVDGDQIWVAAGVYTPGSTINDTFVLTDGVKLYGGFMGVATETVATRNYTANLTILSGDIDGDDITDGGVVTDTNGINGTNSYHVVSADGVTNTAVIDGFIITAGQANGSSPNDRGGGMYNVESSPTLANVIFSGNSAYRGGGIYIWSNSSPSLVNVIFSGNSATRDGGGMYNVGSSSSLSVVNATFSGNSAAYDGGGMYNSSSNPSVVNVTFSGNSAYRGGGGMYNNFISNPSVVNVTFSGNSALVNGGGMYNNNSSPTLVNTIMWHNSAAGMTNTITATLVNTNFGIPTISNSLIANSGGSGSWDSSIATDGGNNIDVDPLFVTPINPSSSPTTAGNLQLQDDSPAIDGGDMMSYTAVTSVTTDLAGNPRIVGPMIDMGAYESSVTSYPLFLPLITQAGLPDLVVDRSHR